MSANTRRPLISIAVKALVLLFGLAGQLVSIAQHSFMSGNHFLYYTNLSNALIILLMPVLIAYEIKGLRIGGASHQPSWLEKLRFVLSSAILLTFAGFSLLLMPFLPASYLLSPANLLVHNAVPLLACADFLLFPASENKPRLRLGLLGPLVYSVLVAALAIGGHRFHGSIAPYFFLDFEKNGWFTIGQGRLGVAWWSLLLFALQLGLSWLILKLRRKPPALF